MLHTEVYEYRTCAPFYWQDVRSNQESLVINNLGYYCCLVFLLLDSGIHLEPWLLINKYSSRTY
jgi:hypothetical protein